MRGPVSHTDHRPVSTAYRVSGPVPGIFHEDPLFLELCAAFDELLGPLVAALDCFPAYLDPRLAPEDFLGWLAALAGAGPSLPGPAGPELERARRAGIAGAALSSRMRGTVRGLREAVAAATGVTSERVAVAECGSVAWADSPGDTAVPAFDPTVEVTITVAAGADVAATAAAALAVAQPGLPVFSQLRITVVEA